MLRPLVLLTSLAMLLALPVPEAEAATKRPTERIVGLGFEDVVDRSARLPTIARRLDQVRANGVSLSVGRVDWAAFPWAAGPHTWSAAVSRTRRDYVAEAIRTVRRPATGKPRKVVLVVDTLVEGWIARQPEIAGVDARGRASDEFPSLSQLESGEVGRRIVGFAGAVARRYRPHAVSLTELFNASHTFGADDLASYRRHTGARDWPRTKSGGIDQWHPSIARWRSKVIAGVVARARAATRAAGVPLWMEVRVNWSDPAGERAESGHDYDLLLRRADRLVLWGYFATADRPASSLKKVAKAARKRAPGRFVMSVGLWADGDASITPGQLGTASRATVKGGIRSVWVTPTSRMTAQHWKALAKAWRS